MAPIHNLAAGVQAFTANAFLVQGDRTVLVDTGANFDIVSRIEDRTDSLDAIVLTHTHPDHIGNVKAVKTAFDVETWGFDTGQSATDNPIADEERLTIGSHSYRAFHTPGHKNDHLCLYAAEPGILFAGDLVFQNGSFGRTDLEEGDRARLIESIDRLCTVVSPDLSEMHVGHGQSVLTDPYAHIELAGQMARR